MAQRIIQLQGYTATPNTCRDHPVGARVSNIATARRVDDVTRPTKLCCSVARYRRHVQATTIIKDGICIKVCRGAVCAPSWPQARTGRYCRARTCGHGWSRNSSLCAIRVRDLCGNLRMANDCSSGNVCSPPTHSTARSRNNAPVV